MFLPTGTRDTLSRCITTTKSPWSPIYCIPPKVSERSLKLAREELKDEYLNLVDSGLLGSEYVIVFSLIVSEASSNITFGLPIDKESDLNRSLNEGVSMYTVVKLG